MNRIVALIATRKRPDVLVRALESVVTQTLGVDRVIVVGDEDTDFPENKKRWNHTTQVSWMLNSRTRCLSGALNTGIIYAFDSGFDPSTTFIAILDDDDEWDATYIEKCESMAREQDLDWVIAGLIRHELSGKVINLSIPSEISPSIIFQRNPHVQGSNMFIKLSCLLEAGMYDENLRSTTDRDMCIRVLDLGDVKYGFLHEHLVHHHAEGEDRLSTFGSPAKKDGLTAFFSKYYPRMTSEESVAFLKRARESFGVELSEITTSFLKSNDDTNQTLHEIQSTPVEDFQLVIGVTASHVDCIQRLAGDIVHLFEEASCIKKVIIIDNSEDYNGVDSALATISRKTSIKVSIITMDTANKSATQGYFGDYYKDPNYQHGIAYGRSVLHRYVFDACEDLSHPVAWILDDDMRLNELGFGRNAKIEPRFFREFISWLIKGKHDIVVGGVNSDPPLPIASSIRVQLIELVSLLQSLLARGKQELTAAICAYREALLSLYPDSYYDLTTSHFGHLETPLLVKTFKNEDQDTWAQLPKILEGLKNGRNVLRKSMPVSKLANAHEIPWRGGNTLVFDVEAFRVFLNIAPIIDGIAFRRGDSLWCVLNKHLGGEKMYAKKKKVVSLPFFIRQERHDAMLESPILNHVFLGDIHGAAFTRCMDSFLKQRDHVRTPCDPFNGMIFTDEDLDAFLTEMEGYQCQRLSCIETTAYRIRGLVKIIKQILRSLENKGEGNEYASNIVDLQNFIDWIYSEYSPIKIKSFHDKVIDFNYSAVRNFLQNLQKNNLSYSSRMKPRFDEGEKAWMISTLSKAGINNAEFFKRGVEAALFSDGVNIYKFFYSGIAQFHSRDLEFFEKNLNPEKNLQYVTPVLGIFHVDDVVIFKMPRVDGNQYAGGQLDKFYELARECKRNGFLTRNLSPENIISTNDRLVYVDIGRDVAPFSEESYVQMCKRAYLCYRWHFKPDIKVLMRKTLKEDKIPELFGFPWFLEATNVHTTHDWMDDIILDIIARLKVTNLLDYGCRNGLIADKIGSRGIKVACYDIDKTHFSKHNHDPNVNFVDTNELDERKTIGFDAILCNRVLCSIESEVEVDAILENLRCLVSNNGHVIIGICNPFDIDIMSTTTHHKMHNKNQLYQDRFPYFKKILSTGETRVDFHRPIEWYKHRFAVHSFDVITIHETEDIDTNIIAPSSEVLFFVLEPVSVPHNRDVTLLIKASQAEWRTIDVQVKHLVSQLEGPEKFFEKILVTDDWTGPFARQYDDANPPVFHSKLASLIKEKYLDRIIIVPNDVNETIARNKRWFGIESTAQRAANGQPVHVMLYGFDQCKTDLVLQVDSDILVHRPSRDDGYLQKMGETIINDPDGLTMSLPIYNDNPIPITSSGDRGNWRIEVRGCLISRKRLEYMLPLQNKEVEGNKLENPWHRAVDDALCHYPLRSYRGNVKKIAYIHVPNERKANFNEWYSIMKTVENGNIARVQEGNVELRGSITDWLGRRDEQIIVLARGRDVPIAKIRRCLASLDEQDEKNWGLVMVDARSVNGSEQFLRDIVCQRYKNRVTLFENLEPCTPMENIYFVIHHICTNPDSLLVMVDLDDALIGNRIFSTLNELVAKGVDLTVGTMLRTDKYKDYPVDFANPREKRGGNVWQHLRTFKKSLFDKIPREYFQIDGKWIPHAEDWAFMIPLVELAEKPYHIKDVVYFYEPSPDKGCRSTVERESIIAKIMGKPSLRKADKNA